MHLPIAVCLVRTGRASLNLLVHQVQPENTKSISDFIGRSGCIATDLVHHVLFFTFLSYAECQARIRTFIAKDAKANMVGRTKVIVGDERAISEAMTRLSLDSTKIDRQLEGLRSWRRGDTSEEEEEDEDEYEDDFINDEEEEEEEEEEDCLVRCGKRFMLVKNDDDVDEQDCSKRVQIINEDEVEVNVAVESNSLPILRRLIRMSDCISR